MPSSWAHTEIQWGKQGFSGSQVKFCGISVASNLTLKHCQLRITCYTAQMREARKQEFVGCTKYCRRALKGVNYNSH